MYLSDFQYRKNLDLLCDSLKRGEVVSLRFCDEPNVECRCDVGPEGVRGILLSSVFDEFGIVIDDRCSYAVFDDCYGWSILYRVYGRRIKFTFQKMF